MILVDTNVVIRSYEGADALLTSGPSTGSKTHAPDPLEQINAVWESLLTDGTVGTIGEVLEEVKQEPASRWKRLVETKFPNCVAERTEKNYAVLKKYRNSWTHAGQVITSRPLWTRPIHT